MQDATKRAGNPRDRHGEDALAWTPALCLVGALHVCVEVLRGIPKAKVA